MLVQHAGKEDASPHALDAVDGGEGDVRPVFGAGGGEIWQGDVCGKRGIDDVCTVVVDMSRFRIGIDSYSLSPLKLSPIEVLEWAARHGAEGVQFSEVNLPAGRHVDEGLLAEMAQFARERDLYLEWGGGQHIPFDTSTWQRCDLGPINLRAAQQAKALGTRVVRSCSGGLMRWHDDAPSTEALLRDTARELKKLKSTLTDMGVTLAIELHFEFTTFELLRLFEMCEAEPGGYLGICVDTMNLLTMLEDPVAGTERVLPWVVAVHAKDGGLALTEGGLMSFTAEVGQGVVDFPRIVQRLSRLEEPPNLSIEDHGGSFDIPILDPTFLSRFPDLTVGDLARLLQLAAENERRPPEWRVAPLARSEWPTHCEQRVAAGIEKLKAIVRRGQQR